MNLKRLFLVLLSFLIIPVIITILLWTKGLLQQEYYTYRYEKKIDQVYENYLFYVPEFLS